MLEDLVDWSDFGGDFGVSAAPQDFSGFFGGDSVDLSGYGNNFLEGLAAQDYSDFGLAGVQGLGNALGYSYGQDYMNPMANWSSSPAAIGATNAATDLAALKDPWALGAGALAGAMDYMQKQKYYKMAEEKMKQDRAWGEEQRRRQRTKQTEYDEINKRDPAGVANIGSIVQNRGSYSGYGAPTNYGRVGGTAPRRMFAAEGGRATLPDDYKPGPLNFLRYLMAGRKFPWEQNVPPTEQPVVERLQEYGSGQQRRRRLDEMEEQATQGRAKGGALGHLRGPTKGQSDKIPAALSDGEYVMDADVVSALGDGNNEAGAAELDKMRENVRKHKRAAPLSKIPPKAKKPEAYLKKEK